MPFISGTHLGLMFLNGLELLSSLSSSSFTVCVGSPICMCPHSESPPSAPDHQPLQDHGYMREREYETLYTSCHFVNNHLQKKKRVLPPVFVFDGWRLLCLDLMKKRSEDSPGFPQLVTLIK